MFIALMRNLSITNLKFNVMASTSETGHAKNVANFDEMISNIQGYKTVYNPSKLSIKLDALQTLSINAKNGIDGVNAAIPAYSNAVAARDAAFSPLRQIDHTDSKCPEVN